MSSETMQWLNTMTLIGNTDARGRAWHWRASEQGAETNHYPGAIPVADVERRLFNWSAVPRRVAVEVPTDIVKATHLDDNGVPMRWTVQEERQAICRSDDHETLGMFTTGYEVHQYREWLLGSVSQLLGDTLGISSAGLLRKGAIAWVEVSVPDTITTPEGVAFRPNLLATTSMDGSCATTYKRTFCMTVCDNTRAIALSEKSPTYKIRHSKYSKIKLDDARKALAMVHDMAEDFQAEVAELCKLKVTDRQWASFLDLTVPLVDEAGKAKVGRSKTMADRKRDGLIKLYRHDDRVSPWAGSAFGVLQCLNTYEHHEATVRGTTRQERNMLRTITGDFDTVDRSAWANLQLVLS